MPLPGTDERMAARIFLPEDAESHPVPAILEYLPYRKREFTAVRDTSMHRYFAGHGYVSVRIDMRGSGDADGLMTDEYLAQELEDGKAAIAWLAQQPWCDGNVGMIGNSWGGFNDLQIAALRPPELKAIITSCSTDDRYADDMHYMGGTLLTDDLDWGASFYTWIARPPDPPIVGDRWRADVAEPPRAPQLHGRGLAAPPAPRRVLEARLGQRGLGRPSSAPCSRSAAGWTATRTPFRGCCRTCACPGWA